MNKELVLREVRLLSKPIRLYLIQGHFILDLGYELTQS